MHLKPTLELLDGIQLGISVSEDLLIFLERSNQGILDENVQLLEELHHRIAEVKDSQQVPSNWNIFGENISQILQENFSYDQTDAKALGMLKEVQISCHLGFCSSVILSRITRCFVNYGFPTHVNKMTAEVNLSLSNNYFRKLVMILKIGKFKLTAVNNVFIRQVLESGICVVPSGRFFGKVTIPGSKSISNRVLLLAALGHGTCEIDGLLNSDDIQCMLGALTLLGVSFEWKGSGESLVVFGKGGQFEAVPPKQDVYLRNSGTASRFLTSVFTFVPTRNHNQEMKNPKRYDNATILTGSTRMKERPIGPLVTALCSNGCKIEYVESEGCLPIAIYNTGINGGLLELEGKVSSQYVSSILMSAPYAKSPLTLQLAEKSPTSLPYILMTIDLMKSFGITVEFDGVNRFVVPTGVYTNPRHWNVEPDASSATYMLAMAAITGGEVTVRHLGSKSLQGDANFFKVLGSMGCDVEQNEDSTTVRGPSAETKLQAVTLNMESLTDAFMTVAVLAAVANGKTQITGIANQRVKECNRIQVMVNELTKIGVSCCELPDGMWIEGVSNISSFKTPAFIECWDDHRIALSFAVLGSKIPGIVITDKDCTSKTYPSFWDDCRYHQMQLSPGSEALGVSTNQNQVPSIYLIGMRGCGKSTFGKLGAAALGRRFLCMDKILETEFGISVNAFVTQHGWPAFRAAEVILLRRIIENVKYNAIVSCGGGIVESVECVELLFHTSHVVHIQRNFEELKNSLKEDQNRPNLPEDLNSVWTRRKLLFEKCSRFNFNVEVVNDCWERSTEEFIHLLEQISKG